MLWWRWSCCRKSIRSYRDKDKACSMIIILDQKYSVRSLDFFLKNYTTDICVGLDKCQTNKQTNSQKTTIYQTLVLNILNLIRSVNFFISSYANSWTHILILCTASYGISLGAIIVFLSLKQEGTYSFLRYDKAVITALIHQYINIYDFQFWIDLCCCNIIDYVIIKCCCHEHHFHPPSYHLPTTSIY